MVVKIRREALAVAIQTVLLLLLASLWGLPEAPMQSGFHPPPATLELPIPLEDIRVLRGPGQQIVLWQGDRLAAEPFE